MDFLYGKTGIIESIDEIGKVKLSGIKTNGWSISTDMIKPVSKREADRIAKLIAADKKKEEIELKEALRKLPEAAHLLVAYFKANTDAFGCQRKHVFAICEMLTGADSGSISKIVGR